MLAGIAVLLLLILVVRLHAFIALLIASIVTGLLAGMDGTQLMAAMQEGMGGTLGFVAVIIGLGAMFGAILETSGGARATAAALIARFGMRRSPWAMLVAGFATAIPVFFDVALIILMPVIYGLQRRSGASLLVFAMPLLAGLAVTHAFIPPTPGPVAVAEILGADLGLMIAAGLIAGIPAAIAGGMLWGRYVSQRIFVAAPQIPENQAIVLPPARVVLSLIALPVLLILVRTLLLRMDPAAGSATEVLRDAFDIVGHPFVALIIANLLAWYLLGIRRGMDREKLLQVTTRSFAPAGSIILLTGAGGVFKQVLVDTGSGEVLAGSLLSAGIPLILFAYLAAVMVRVLQGSATVAMIAAAGLTAPLLAYAELSPVQIACAGIAISAGATTLSHVNDSGFWLVSQYLGLTERQTFRSWSVMTAVVGITGMAVAWIVYWVM